jgi:hypothetical protein
VSRSTVTPGLVGEHNSLILENDHVRAVILPELGGRVWTLEDRRRNRQWIWHRPGVPLAHVGTDAVYDDVWAGGWEELFPNDAPGMFEGRSLPDHGEWWTMAWRASTSTSAAAACVRLAATAHVVRTECAKEFTLAHDGSALTVTYRLRSLEQEPFHFLFKQHLPVDITPNCRLRLPGGSVEAVDPAFGTLLQGRGPYTWPETGRTNDRHADLCVIPPQSSAAREFVYVDDLPAPWCGVDDLDRQASLRMEYDAGRFPYVWLFLSYGGWRETYTAVLEPCTNRPKDLTRAVELGQSARLSPGEEFVTSVTVRLGDLDDSTR